MKLFRLITLGIFILLLGAYINIIGPINFIRADDSSTQTQTQDSPTPTGDQTAPTDTPSDPTVTPTGTVCENPPLCPAIASQDGCSYQIKDCSCVQVCTTPNATPTDTPTPTQTPQPGASCSFSPATLSLKDGETGKAAVFYSTQNIASNAKHVTVCLGVDDGAPAYISDTGIDYGSYPVSLDVTPSHKYTAFMFLKDASDDPKSCSGSVVNTCSMTTTVNNCGNTNQGGSGNNNNNNCNDNNNNNNNSNNQNQGQSQGQTQNNNQTQNFNPSINNTNNNNIALYGYRSGSGYPPVYGSGNPSSLPNTGTPLTDVLSIFAMSGVGFVIRKFTKLG